MLLHAVFSLLLFLPAAFAAALRRRVDFASPHTRTVQQRNAVAASPCPNNSHPIGNYIKVVDVETGTGYGYLSTNLTQIDIPLYASSRPRVQFGSHLTFT